MVVSRVALVEEEELSESSFHESESNDNYLSIMTPSLIAWMAHNYHIQQSLPVAQIWNIIQTIIIIIYFSQWVNEKGKIFESPLFYKFVNCKLILTNAYILVVMYN